MSDYEIIDHEHDVVVVGAGGAGLRATLGMVSGGYVVNHYLTDPDAWFVKTDVPNGLKHFERMPMATL